MKVTEMAMNSIGEAVYFEDAEEVVLRVFGVLPDLMTDEGRKQFKWISQRAVKIMNRSLAKHNRVVDEDHMQFNVNVVEGNRGRLEFEYRFEAEAISPKAKHQRKLSEKVEDFLGENLRGASLTCDQVGNLIAIIAPAADACDCYRHNTKESN
jgi:hypothetical protein